MKIITREPAQTIADVKREMAKEVALELDALVDHLDAFLELRINQEFAELRESMLDRITELEAENYLLRNADQVSS